MSRPAKKTPTTTTPTPIITLTTDFGLADAYVAQLRGVILRAAPRATIVDVSHLVPRHDILAGALAIERALAVFPVGTVHVAVVDPGVGTDRRLIVAQVQWQTLLCPDNGLITWAWWRATTRPVVRELTWRPTRTSATFHGRDILAPVAAMLASGRAVRSVAGALVEPILLDVAPAEVGSRRGQIIHIDGYGNATTNVPVALLAGVKAVRVGRRSIPLRRTYGDVARGQPLALVGSSDLLEIAVREGSAVDVLGVGVGDRVLLQ
jgi:S-adenosylmethionine hydrolase